jgi:hypothetical protein
MPDIEALKAAVLAESVYNLVNQGGDRPLAGIPEALLAVWDPGAIEVTAETVAAATKRLADEGLVKVGNEDDAPMASPDFSQLQVSIPNRGRNGRGTVIHVDHETGDLRLGPPK